MLKVGDFVTWRSGGPNSLGITGCQIQKLDTINGRPAAMIDIGQFGRLGEDVWAAVDHLTLEEPSTLTKAE